MKKTGFPVVPIDLLKALEEKFPDTLPDDPKVSLDDFRLLQGCQRVIRFLRHQHEKQNENILNG